MSLTKQQKENTVKQTQEDLNEAVSSVFVSYNQLTVEEINELRDSLHSTGGSMRVIPKRLLKIVLHNIKLDFDPTELAGQFAVVWGTDAVAPAKTLNDFAKKHEDKITMMAGSLEGNLLSLEEVKSLAALPTRDQLLGQLLSVFTGPTRGLVTVMSGVQRNTVQVLQAIADQKNTNS